MGKLPSWSAPAALDWLQTLLQERFGHLFTLLMISDNMLAIGRVGDSRSITFTVDTAMFRRGDPSLPCASWDGLAEGWNTVLADRKSTRLNSSHT